MNQTILNFPHTNPAGFAFLVGCVIIFLLGLTTSGSRR